MKRLTLPLVSCVIAAACQTSSAGEGPAVLARTDDATLAQVKDVMARAMGVARVELGPLDPAQGGTFSALPAPLSSLEDRSLALPTTFRLILEGDRCSLVRADTGARYRLEGVACRLAKT